MPPFFSIFFVPIQLAAKSPQISRIFTDLFKKKHAHIYCTTLGFVHLGGNCGAIENCPAMQALALQFPIAGQVIFSICTKPKMVQYNLWKSVESVAKSSLLNSYHFLIKLLFQKKQNPNIFIGQFLFLYFHTGHNKCNIFERYGQKGFPGFHLIHIRTF